MEVPFLDASGDAYEIGETIGRTFADRLRAFIGFKQEVLRKDTQNQRSVLEQASARFLKWCRQCGPHLIDEMRGYADGAGVSLDDVVMMNCGDEARACATAASSEGCTAFALAPQATGGPVLAGQSKDGPGPQWDHYVVLRIRPKNRPALLQLAYPGMLALLGMSETGMCICTNQIHDGVRSDGLPVMLIKRLAWEIESVADVERLIQVHHAATASNFLLCDRSGNAICLELRGEHYGRVDMDDGILIHANHYLTESLRGHEDPVRVAAHGSPLRQSRLAALFNQRRGRITVSDVFACYRDHRGYPNAICAHESTDEYRGTTAVFVAEPQAGLLHVNVGRTCQNHPQTYALTS